MSPANLSVHFASFMNFWRCQTKLRVSISEHGLRHLPEGNPTAGNQRRFGQEINGGDNRVARHRKMPGDASLLIRTLMRTMPSSWIHRLRAD
jgi:hypothetical protein